MGSDVNLWTYKMWSDFLGEDYDLSKYTDDIITGLEAMSDKSNQGLFLSGGEAYLYATDDDISFHIRGCNFCPSSDNSFKSDIMFTGNAPLFIRSYSSTYNSGLKKYIINNHFISSSDFVIVNDIDTYNSFVAGCDYPDNIFYCLNPLQTFIDFIESSAYDDMFYDVYPLKDGYQNIIRFYDCFDSYYGKYQYDFYNDNMLNYLNSSYSINSPIYYQPKGVTTAHQLDGADLQHNEMYYIYIPVPDDFSITNANDYLTSIGTAIHYEKGPVDFSTWYNDYIVPWLSKWSVNTNYRLITLNDVEPSTSDNPTVNTSDTKQDVNLLRITFPSSYTFLESTSDDGGFIMSGCRTMSTAQKVDISDGSIDNSAKDGVGSNIDGGDYLDDKDADELLNDGWKNGYPNKSSYPYKITINKNGYVLYEIYFDNKPSIEANFYSDSQIAYDVDFNLTRGYVYAKQQNCYLDFNFRNKVEDDYLTSDGTLIDAVTDEAQKAMANQFARMVNTFINNVQYVTKGDDYEYIDHEKYLTTKIMRLWTNYTGQLTGTYRGYYVQFNWDLEQDSDFIKNNSDDDHNYSDDYLDDGDGFVDNNGNTHGGATELPTDDPEYSGFNNEDFSFDETNLWGYANSFLTFSFHAFKMLPAFIWSLLGCGIVIMIILRILGR